MDNDPPLDHAPPSDSSSGILTEHLDDDLSLGTEFDPFDVDDYKLLFHRANGRNIVDILLERSCCGSKGSRGSRRGMRSTETAKEEEDVSMCERSDGAPSPGPSTPILLGTPPVMQNPPFGLSPPPHRTSREVASGDLLEQNIHAQIVNGGPSTPVSNSNTANIFTEKPKPSAAAAAAPKPPNPPPTSLHSELISYVEYSSATRFKAAYLKHLGGSANNQRFPNSPMLPINGSMTREQLETQELLRQHLRQEGRNLPGVRVLVNDFPRRLLNPLQRREAENGNAPPHPHRPLPHNNNRMPNRPNPNPSVSTISISFSPDGRTLASTHGDHSVKITCAHTGKLIRTLEGHPRTPWTVKYHPINNRIVASGCLGFQVRIWDWNYRTEAVRGKWRRDNERRYSGRYNGEAANVWDGRCCSPRGVMEGSTWKGYKRKEKKDDGEDDFAASSLEELGIPSSDPAWYDVQAESFNYHDGIGVCLNMIRLNHAIISLAFHPSGEILAVASGSTLHLWDYDEEGRKLRKKKLSDNLIREADSHSSSTPQPQQRLSESSILNRDRTSDFPTSRTLHISHESALRCVHFPPCGKTLIIGGVNPTSANEGLAHRHPRGRGGMSGGGMSFNLRLWDFDLDAVLNPPTEDASANEGGVGANVLGAVVSDEGEVTWNFSGVKKPLSDPRIIIPRVLLYNDGGFDLSQDGKILSACAEYWLPEGIDNAMEMLQQVDDDEKQDALNTPDDSRPASPAPEGVSGVGMSTPSSLRPSFSMLSDPRTPPPHANCTSLEPPPPPGNRNLPRMYNFNSAVGPGINQVATTHTPHPLSIVAPNHPAYENEGGRYVPHIVTISMDTSPPLRKSELKIDCRRPILEMESLRRYPRLGQLLNAAPLDGAKASGVTCVKLSPSAEYCLLGYGVRDNLPSTNGNDPRHPVTALYHVNKGMQHISTLTSIEDDVNIARFHPESGHGFVYGTKQGRVRVLSTRPWNYYHL